MISSAPHPWLRDETNSATYTLPKGAHPVVSVGDSVRAGDILAQIPAPPHLLAFADALHISPDASRNTIASLDGSFVEAGAPIHSRRSGLRVRTLRAPHAGTVCVLSECGAVTVRRREGNEPLRAMRAGVVTSVQSTAIIVESRVVRGSFAFAIGPLSVFGLLVIPIESPERPPRAPSDEPEGTDAVRALAYIGEVTELASILRRATGPLIVGTVSDAVAWELLTRDAPSAERENRAVIVLFGPGDPERGATAVRRLRTYDGAMMSSTQRSGEIVIFPEKAADATAERHAEEGDTDAAMYIDPARWNTPCNVDGGAHMALLDTGARTLVRRTSAEGHRDERTPITNIATRPEFG